MSWARSGIQSARSPDISSDNMASLEEYANEESARLQARMEENNRMAKVSLWMMSNPKSFLSLSNPDIAGLFVWTVVALILNAAAAITLFVIFGTVSAVSNSNVQFTFNSIQQYGWWPQNAVVWNATALAAIACTIAALGYAADLAMWGGKVKNLQCRQNWVRWVLDSLSTPLLWITVLALIGFNDIVTALFQFLLVHVAIALGGLVDLVNAPKNGWNGTAWWPYLFSLWVGALAVLPVIVVLARSNGLNYVNGLNYGSFAVLLCAWAVQSWLQRGYYMWLSDPTKKATYNSDDGPVKNYVRYETMILVASTALRVIAAFLIGFAYTNNNGWTNNHNCFAANWQAASYPVADAANAAGGACPNAPSW